MRRTYNRYTVATLAACLVLVAGACALIFIVDPYALHGQQRIEGFNAKKPFAYTHAKFTKRRLAAASHARTLFLGNSRIDAGFDPHSPALPEAARPGFNFAIPGQTLAGDYHNLASTPGLEEITQVIIGVDYADFTFDGHERVLPRDSSGRGSGLMHFARTNVSMTALSDAVLTVIMQKSAFTNSMTRLGANTFAAHTGYVRTEGHFALFHQRNIENARAYLRRDRQVRSDSGRVSPSFEYLRWLLDWCRGRGAQVHLIIYPYHAQLLELLHLTGHWPAFEQWKRSLLEVVETAGAGVMLWDFSGYHAVASEPVPARGDTQTDMRWYWEAGHFKVALGDLMLTHMFGGSPQPEFGVRLSAKTINAAIDVTRGERKRWRVARPMEASHVELVYRSVVEESR